MKESFNLLSPINTFVEQKHEILKESVQLVPFHESEAGILFASKCEDLLKSVKDECFDMIFADPPFNLGKTYRASTDDSKSEADYVQWCKEWLDECIRTLKPGGALWLYNLPKWNIILGAYLMERGLDMRHWIAIELTLTLPRPKRLYPSHYSLLYLTKGEPKTFNAVRTPIGMCRHCHKPIKDYGGHAGKMNDKGVNLKDVWTDITPVRHAKYKHAGRKGVNALSTKITDRAIMVSTNPDDVVFDPFGGTGTTYASAKQLKRRWVGVEVDYCQEIVDRLTGETIESHPNTDWCEGHSDTI